MFSIKQINLKKLGIRFADIIIFICLISVILVYIRGGYSFDLFKWKVSVRHYRNPAIMMVLFLIIRQMFVPKDVFISRLFRFAQAIKYFFKNENNMRKMYFCLMGVLAVIIFLNYLPSIGNIFNIPVNKPYYTGEWDEPHAINAGINVLRTKGDPIFYNYGGTCIYPHALVFYLYCKKMGITPTYSYLNEKFKYPEWPVIRKIYPIKPIYITKVVACLLYLLGSFLFVLLFSLFLIPVPFWIIPSITTSGIFGYYSGQMLPETHVGLLAGFTAIFFAKALIEKRINKYYLWVVFCAFFSSLTIAAKINGLYITLLPLSLLWRLIKEKYISWKRLSVIIAVFVVPYVLVNPAIVLNSKAYYEWIIRMLKWSKNVPCSWMNRTSEIFPFVRDLYLFNMLPNIILILLFIVTCILLVKLDFAAFAGFMFFYLFSLQSIANMSHNLYPRHFVFLVLPFNFIVLFPLIYFYNRVKIQLKVFFAFLCIAVTLTVYPIKGVIDNCKSLMDKKFTTQWQRESRDDLIDFVKNNNAIIYFYDLHGFSLPNNIYDKIIPFSEVNDIPEKLDKSEFVGLILYEKSDMEKYNSDVQYLMKKYKKVQIYGNPKGAHDIREPAPIGNPTIVILK